MRKDVVRQGRLSGTRSAAVTRFLSSMAADRNIARADLLVDIAHVLMLDTQKINKRAITKPIISTLLDFYDNGIPDEVFEEQYEDVHAGIESLLIESIGPEAGGRMHIGRSRNDEVAACLRIRLREDLLAQMTALQNVRAALLAIADKHTSTAMPGFTHLQHAQPTTLAHYLLAYEQTFARDFDRLQSAYTRVNLSPLGAAAFASTGYPINRDLTAGLLGFDGLVTNTMDAVATRDFALETLADVGIMMTNVSRLCEELILWSSAFVRFVTLDDSVCSTSSIMPQKKNPDVAEIMRAKSGAVFGAYSAAFVTVKGLPMSYNRDLQDLTPHLWRGVQDARESTIILAEMLDGATFSEERMAEEAGKGFSTATELADSLVRSYGLPFRTAHNIVGRAVQKGDLSLATLEAAAHELDKSISLEKLGLTEDEVEKMLDVGYSLSLRTSPGGPAPAATKKSVAQRKRQLNADTAATKKIQTSLILAEKILITSARRLVA